MFCYGSLLDPEVQLAVFGRLLQGVADAVAGYRAVATFIADPADPAQGGTYLILRRGEPDDLVAGMALEITPEDLPGADAYEGPRYRRLEVTLASGLTAFVYADASLA